MKISKLKIISSIDKIFITSVFTLFSFVWIKYFIRNNIYSFLLSLFLSMFIVSLFSLIQKNKFTKRKIKIETNKEINSYIYSFLLLKSEETLKLFYEKLKQEGAVLHNNVIILNKTCIIPKLDVEILSINDVSKIYQSIKNSNINKIKILTIEAKEDCINFAKSIKNFDIEILTKSETFYAYIQRYAIYPEILVAQKTSKKESFFNIIKFCFKKEKAKSYVFSGIVLLILSFFFRYNLYYVIVSSLLFLCSIICFFQKQKQT